MQHQRQRTETGPGLGPHPGSGPGSGPWSGPSSGSDPGDVLLQLHGPPWLLTGQMTGANLWLYGGLKADMPIGYQALQPTSGRRTHFHRIIWCNAIYSCEDGSHVPSGPKQTRWSEDEPGCSTSPNQA